MKDLNERQYLNQHRRDGFNVAAGLHLVQLLISKTFAPESTELR